MMPCLYEDGPRTETKISHQVGDINLHRSSVPLCEGYDRRKKGVVGIGGHFEEYYKCIDKICEL